MTPIDPANNIDSAGPGSSPSAAPEPAMPPQLDRAPLAYENPEFLNSPDGRIVRILSEYNEPLARFRREHIQDTIVFFGSARFHGKPEVEPSPEVPRPAPMRPAAVRPAQQ